MKSILDFIEKINHEMGIVLPKRWQVLPKKEIAQRFLQGINRYFFQTYEGIGVTDFQGEEIKYFSEFHKFWESNNRIILNCTINQRKAEIVARCLNEGFAKYGSKIFKVTMETCGLLPKAIAQVRLFTANQDFREPPENQFGKYLDDPGRFDETQIAEDPEDFLRFLGMTRLSQTDKRLDFARNTARFLCDKRMSAFQIAEFCEYNALKIREMLVNTPNIGYGLKKANMFVRDMVELHVWPDLLNYDGIDVASDVNTMKLALRTGILQTEIPLLSSFLDIFCHQYSYLDEMSAKAWRMVWEKWKNLNAKSAPSSPCLMDFLLYRIGREYCKDNLFQYKCTNGHLFYFFRARVSKCRECKSSAIPVRRFLPCQVSADNLPREEGVLLLPDSNLLREFDGTCIFENVCEPKNEVFKLLEPPKSISIKGKTSWISAYSDKDRGGGGMMS